MRVGVDIGGTKTEAVVVGDDGSVVESIRLVTGQGAEAVVATAVAAVTGLSAQAGIRVADFSTIGVGIPGAVDWRRGTVSHAINLGVDHLALGADLLDRLGSRVRVENDVNAAALGAFHLLGRGPDDSMAYLNLGTGLAAGLVLGGQLWRGARGGAGEIGHILVDPSGPIDLDGQRGGLEVVASGSGIARQWGAGSVLDLLDAADAGDARAVEIRRRLFEGVASAIRILVLTVDVDLVVIGGGLSGLGDRLMVGVTTVLDGWAQQSAFVASLELTGRVRLLPTGSPVAALGAAHLGGSLMAEVVIVGSDAEAGDLAASLIADVVTRTPDAVLGLATGSTPLTTWAALRERGLDLSRVRGFALDEYIGLAPGHPESYAAVISREVVEPLGLTPSLVHVPGDDGAVEGAGERYEAAITAAGGVDLQILGIGRTGHIGFNEPGSSLASLTRVKTLTEKTRVDNARFFDSIDDVPRHCLTQGLGTILRARHLVLLAFGAAKAPAIAAALEGAVSSSVPGSVVQLHPRVTVIVDEAAASALANADYYRHAWANRFL